MPHETKKNQELGTDTLICPHCSAVNPIRAYCCISCFTVVHTKANIPLWKRTVQGNRAMFFFMILFCLASVLTIRKWLTNVEGHLETIQTQNQQYHDSLSNLMQAKGSAVSSSGSETTPPPESVE